MYNVHCIVALHQYPTLDYMWMRLLLLFNFFRCFHFKLVRRSEYNKTQQQQNIEEKSQQTIDSFKQQIRYSQVFSSFGEDSSTRNSFIGENPFRLDVNIANSSHSVYGKPQLIRMQMEANNGILAYIRTFQPSFFGC